MRKRYLKQGGNRSRSRVPVIPTTCMLMDGIFWPFLRKSSSQHIVFKRRSFPLRCGWCRFFTLALSQQERGPVATACAGSPPSAGRLCPPESRAGNFPIQMGNIRAIISPLRQLWGFPFAHVPSTSHSYDASAPTNPQRVPHRGDRGVGRRVPPARDQGSECVLPALCRVPEFVSAMRIGKGSRLSAPVHEEGVLLHSEE